MQPLARLELVALKVRGDKIQAEFAEPGREMRVEYSTEGRAPHYCTTLSWKRFWGLVRTKVGICMMSGPPRSGRIEGLGNYEVSWTDETT